MRLQASPAIGAATPVALTTANEGSVCFAPNGNVSVTTGAAAPCPGTPARSGATLFTRTFDNYNRYKLVIWGLTGLSKLISTW